MTRQDIAERLRNGGRLLLDGGTGSEMQRRGIAITRDWQTVGNVNSWSARALGEAPDVVREVHVDYLKAGADIITTNTFWAGRTRMGMDGMADMWEQYTRLAGEIAVAARDGINPEAYVAGGIAPPWPDAAQNGPELAEQAEVLAEAGVDVMLAEYVGSVEDCVVAVDAVGKVGLPVFLGVKHVETYLAEADRLAEALKGHRVDCILAMCSLPEHISDRLPELRAAFDGPIGGYANIGYVYDSTADDDLFGDYTPDRYTEYARHWLDVGAQVVGGCCATGPEHIQALRPLVTNYPA
jgi:S-methylmethionine-dependent homocysteine/selenocysteine methylase